MTAQSGRKETEAITTKRGEPVTGRPTDTATRMQKTNYFAAPGDVARQFLQSLQIRALFVDRGRNQREENKA
jgi:hypothetical protein